MKCANCGTTNGKTNKFCRECGFQMDQSVQQETEQPVQVKQPESSESGFDELALGEELFEVWQLFEAGETVSSLKIAEKLVEDYPDSASAHSLVALIYERMAETSLDEGRIEDWHSFLKRAIAHYESIIDLNPDSTADREKLAGLRMKLAGRLVHKSKTSHLPPALDRLWAKVKDLPTPVLTAFGAFTVVAVVLFALLSLTAPKGQVRTASAGGSAAAEPLRTVSTPIAPPASQPLTGYSYPSYPQRPQPAPPEPEITPPSQDESDNGGTTRVPLSGAEIRVVPEPKAKPEKVKLPPLKAIPGSKTDTSTVPSLPAPQPRPTSSPSGASTLARAIQLYDQGQATDAVDAAQNAISIFQSDIAAGKNVDAAKRGIANARKLIAVWQAGSGAESSE